MSVNNPNLGEGHVSLNQIVFPDFEISCAAESPWRPGYWFGSEDGRIRFFDPEGGESSEAYEVAPSGDAVNGIAFAGEVMAVSTRSEVVFLRVPRPDEGRQVEQAVFNGGSHGVVATAYGTFVAPLGPEGLLAFAPDRSWPGRFPVLATGGVTMNAYRVASLGASGLLEVVACAMRRCGFAIFVLGDDGQQGSGRRLASPDVDFVDTCSLASPENPYAVAALGADRSIHLTSDALTAKGAKVFRFTELTGTAYRILCADGHLFLLTSKGLYVLPWLVARFLGGEFPVRNQVYRSNARLMEVEAVDASITRDRHVLVMMVDGVCRIPIEGLVPEGEPGGAESSNHISDVRQGHDSPGLSRPDEEWELSDPATIQVRSEAGVDWIGSPIIALSSWRD